jgi:hypothetical protein
MGARRRVWTGVAVAAALLAVWVSAPQPARAAKGIGAPRFGLGFILGEPTGITGKLFLQENHALDFILAYDITDEAFAVAVDYHFVFDLARFSSGRMPLYVGIGGKLAVFGDKGRRHNRNEDVAFGLRVPVGLSFFFDRVPIEIFLEIAPGIRVFPDTSADVDGGIGVRFYF